jgi:hypothetical protein
MSKKVYKDGPERQQANQAIQKRFRDKERALYNKLGIPKSKLVKTYFASPEECAELINRQDSICPICKLKKTLNIDHCHKTNTFRGMVCRQCNAMLGLSYDNVEILASAIKYLNTHNDK